MLEYLVKRLPVMVCPKWVLTKSQPISVDDVVEYLVRSINVKDTVGRDFDIGGRGSYILTNDETLCKNAKQIYKNINNTIPHPKIIFLLGRSYYPGKGIVGKTINR